MSDEAAFLRAIQADPTDATAKLVYADWLDEHGESEKAEYVRSVGSSRHQPTVDITPPRAVELRAQLPDAWLLVLHGWVPLWDEVTMFALGRLQGLLAALKLCSDHASDIEYDFTARLAVRSGKLQPIADRVYGPRYRPVRLEPLADWAAELKAILRAYLLQELGHVSSENVQLAMEVPHGRAAIINTAFGYVTSVISSTAGWRVQRDQDRADQTDVILEAPDRVLFLHFGLSYTD